MSEVPTEKEVLRRYLVTGREAFEWKLDGLSEYDVRRPLTPTATNLLGMTKHVAGVTADYFGVVFGRPFPQRLPWLADDAEDNADMWVSADETREDIVDLWRRAWAHADATIEALPLDATGTVPWWRPGRRSVTLHQICVHMIAELNRHGGHADILREQLDGSVGLRKAGTNLPAGDEAWWAAYRDKVEDAARRASEQASGRSTLAE